VEDARQVLVGLEDVRAAHARIRDAVLRTPLLPWPERVAGRRIDVKAESLQRTGSFKLRGATNALARLPEAARRRGIVAHSSGNHGSAVAHAARLLGIPATVVMPSDAPAVKIARVRAAGIEPVFVEPSSEARALHAQELADAHDLTLIASADHPDVIAGQGTVGLELHEQLAEAADGEEELVVLVPIGAGGLASGVGVAIKALRPSARVIGVEPELAGDARESLRSGQPVRWPSERTGATIADGMRLTSLAPLAFHHLARVLDDVVLVSEAEIRAAMRAAAWQRGLVLEPSGATALAAALHHADELPTGRIARILSGSNVDPARYLELVSEATASR
jgi:threonine dehydratase